MRIAALVESVGHVCCRYRIEAFRKHWENAGHSLATVPLGRSLISRLKAIRRSRDADVVILQRKLLSPTETRILRWHARKLIFDFDDAIWLRDSYSDRGFNDPRRLRRFRTLSQHADALVAGNRYLAEDARAFAQRVSIIPTCVDPQVYPIATHARPAGTAVMVWVGSSSTLQGIERERQLFESIGQAIPGLKFKVICDRFPQFRHLQVEPVRWTQERETVEIAEADIGVGWVPDDPWSRGKCALKLLQYQAAGLAVIANPVGVQADMITPGVHGMIANTTEEWIDAVRSLANDPALRRQLGNHGRNQVCEKFSVTAGAQLWLELLKDLQTP